MASVPKQFYRLSAPTTNTALYTVPSSTTAIITNIVVSNVGSTANTFSILLNGVEIAGATEIPAKSIATFDIKQVLSASEVIAGFASSADVKFHISGVEI